MAPLRALHLAGVVGSALWALRKGKHEETPPHFCCSVTGELYVDPVVVVSSGASLPVLPHTPFSRCVACAATQSQRRGF